MHAASMPDWLKWAFWISPLSYGQIGLSLNEFLAPRWHKVYIYHYIYSLISSTIYIFIHIYIYDACSKYLQQIIQQWEVKH